MADAPEIPEATDPFDKRVALTIAILAICLSFVENIGDNAKTDAIIKTNEASNQWGYFQAKSIKGQMAKMESDLLARMSAPEAEVAQYRSEAQRYDSEKSDIKANAERLQKDAAHSGDIDNRSDEAALLLQIGVVVCSVAILAKSHKFWWAGMVLGVGGIIVGAMAAMM